MAGVDIPEWPPPPPPPGGRSVFDPLRGHPAWARFGEFIMAGRMRFSRSRLEWEVRCDRCGGWETATAARYRPAGRFDSIGCASGLSCLMLLGFDSWPGGRAGDSA